MGETFDRKARLHFSIDNDLLSDKVAEIICVAVKLDGDEQPGFFGPETVERRKGWPGQALVCFIGFAHCTVILLNGDSRHDVISSREGSRMPIFPGQQLLEHGSITGLGSCSSRATKSPPLVQYRTVLPAFRNCRQVRRVCGHACASVPIMRPLRRAEVESFPILRLRGGRMRRLVRGKVQPVSQQEARRIRNLVIPPAWRDVRISADPLSHIQAIGRDEAGRRQYIYHEEWEAVRSAEKAERLRRLIDVLPRVRRTIARDLDHPGDRRVLASAARLVDRLCFRAGYEEYAGEESGRGAATLLRKHVRVANGQAEFDFPGKGKRRIVARLVDPKLARNLEEALRGRGRRLFRLRSGNAYRNMTANDLNAYLAQIAKCEISAKDFRTLRASSLAIARLSVQPGRTTAERRRIVAATCRDISAVLFNTPGVVRKSYVHAPIVAEFVKGTLASLRTRTRLKGCSQGEGLLLDFLQPADH